MTNGPDRQLPNARRSNTLPASHNVLEKPQYRGKNCFILVSELKRISTALCLLALGIILANTVSVGAAPELRRFSLAYFDVDVTYPANGKPGETITISITATVRKDCEVQELSVEFFAHSAAGDFRLIGSVSILKQASVVSGNLFQKSAALAIPTDIPRSFLMAIASETIRTYSYTYSYSYYYAYPYWWWYNTTRYWWWYPVYYGWRTYTDTIDKETGPLTYVLATTPEYTQLKADYDKLTSDHNRLSSDYSALNARYIKLSEEHERLLAENESLTQTLALTRIALYCLVVAVVVIAALLYLRRQGRIVISFQRPARR